jgi:hypothetical protein
VQVNSEDKLKEGDNKKVVQFADKKETVEKK